MATLADGTRVFSAADAAAILAADHNQLQDILIAMLEAREMGLTLLSLPPSGWSWDFTNGGWLYDGATGSPNDRMRFALPFYAGQKLTEVHAAVEVVTGGLVGDIKLFWRTKTPVAGSMPAYGSVALISDVWNIANNTAVLQSATGLTNTFLAGYNYYLDFTPRTGVVCKIHEVTAVAQFGA